MGLRRTYQSDLYRFLENEGGLESADNFAIQDAKKSYWAEYKKKWNKEKRLLSKSYTILFTPKESSYVRQAAKQQQTSTTSFIKRSALSMAQESQLVPLAIVAQIRESLILCYSNIEEQLNEQNLDDRIIQKVLQRLEQAEVKILQTMHY